VPRTGVIGMIAIAGTERFKGGLRVSFVCGGRALARFGRLRTAVDEAIKRVSVHVEELPSAIERLQDDNKALRQTIRAQQEKLAASEAAALMARGEPFGGVTLIVDHMTGWDAQGIKMLASQLTAASGVVAALVGDGDPAPVAIARSDDGRIDAGGVLRQAIAELGGKGGGKPGMAQGAISASAPAILESFRKTLREALA
jgi:alanyl-tRNA synthetase